MHLYRLINLNPFVLSFWISPTRVICNSTTLNRWSCQWFLQMLLVWLNILMKILLKSIRFLTCLAFTTFFINYNTYWQRSVYCCKCCFKQKLGLSYLVANQGNEVIITRLLIKVNVRNIMVQLKPYEYRNAKRYKFQSNMKAHS